MLCLSSSETLMEQNTIIGFSPPSDATDTVPPLLAQGGVAVAIILALTLFVRALAELTKERKN